MRIDSFINNNIPAIGKDFPIADALDLMNSFQVSELPVVSENHLITLVKEEHLLDAPTNQSLVGTVIGNIPSPVVLSKAHPYEAAVRLVEGKLSLLPVIDEQENYLGVVTRNDLFALFFEKTGLAQPGGIIILEIKPMDYSLSEISRICESSDTSILNVQIFFEPNNEWMNVVIKTNKKDLNVLKASFERFEYNVKEVYGLVPSQEDLIDRYQLLMNYINM